METETDPSALAAAETHPDARVGEERRILLFGFGIGITIGLIFLLYIVLGAAHWL